MLRDELAQTRRQFGTAEEPIRTSSLLAALGLSSEAVAIARKVEASHPKDSGEFVIAAETYAMTGDRAAAIRALEEAAAAGYDDRYYLLINPALVGIQDDPALKRLAPSS